MRRVGAGFGEHGFRVRLATASTIGAAVAMAGWGDGRGVRAIPRGAERAMLGPLPIESLRISAAAAEALRSVEVETVDERGGRLGVLADRIAHLLDKVEEPGALVGCQRLAQERAEAADVLAQRGIEVHEGVRGRDGHGQTLSGGVDRVVR